LIIIKQQHSASSNYTSMKIITIYFFVFLMAISKVFCQSKKEQIAILNVKIDSLNLALINQTKSNTKSQGKIDSLNLALIDEKKSHTKCQEEKRELNLKLAHAEKQISTLSSANSELLAKNFKLSQDIDTSNIINDRTIKELIGKVENTDLNIGLTNEYIKGKYRDLNTYKLDFSKESIDSLSSKYNVNHEDGVETIITTDGKNKLLFIKYKVNCCPGDNNEGIIFPMGDQLISIHHYYGMFGGVISFKLDGIEKGILDYSMEDGKESNHFINIFNE